MEFCKFNNLGQWELEKAIQPKSDTRPLVYANSGTPVDTEKHQNSKNFQTYQKLIAAHGGGHFGYRPETGEIIARTDHAKNLVAQARAGQPAAPQPAAATQKPVSQDVMKRPAAPATSVKVIDKEPKGYTIAGYEPVHWPKSTPKT